jgi:hypothetical protein
MVVLVRKVGCVLALVAFLGGALQVQPCLEDDDCADSCATSATVPCPAADDHHDPDMPIHSCVCMCHVPAVAMAGPTHVSVDAPTDLQAVPQQAPLSSGYLDTLFRPPRA